MSLGYKDTPLLPGGQWTVHDSDRPQPAIVDAGTESSQEVPGKPPSDAIVLFGDSDLSEWQSCNDGGEAKWKTQNGYVEVAPGTGNIKSKKTFGDVQLHLELMAPLVVKGNGQGRGNSGIFLMEKYEIQVLDNYNNPTYADGTAGALYGQCPPLVNSCRKPGLWNIYDIIWQGPRFDGEELIRSAYVTVLYNGVVLHHHKELQGPTEHRKLSRYQPHPKEGALILQDHGDLVRFRNIWVRPLRGYDQA